MAGAAPPGPRAGHGPPRWLVYVIILGLYLSLRGYHSYDGDQAYRLPLLLHEQDPSVLAADPFVAAFTAFNPHRGSLWVLDLVTRPLGLSAGLFVLFALTFAATCRGIDRLARAVVPESGSFVGVIAAGLLLSAKAGNIGTNHLFEAMLLDRLMAFAAGWLALAETVAEPNRAPWRSAVLIGLATLVHPSAGLQLAMVLAASRAIWCVLHRWTRVSISMAISGAPALALAVVPGLAINFSAGSSLQHTMPDNLFWLLSVELQSPQHMLPHLWRMPQWLAWSCYLALAALALAPLARPRALSANFTGDADPESRPQSATCEPAFAKRRLVLTLATILVGLSAAWYVIEFRHHVRVTIFQPFRMATLARGIALVMLAGRLVALWRRGDALARMRAILLPVALTGDWLLVVTTAAELAVSATESIRILLPRRRTWSVVDWTVWLLMIAAGLNFLGHHDTEYGHIPLLATLGLGLAVVFIERARKRGYFLRWSLDWTPRRLRGRSGGLDRSRRGALRRGAAARLLRLPVVLSAGMGPDQSLPVLAVPLDDIERLAVWCREHTPQAPGSSDRPVPRRSASGRDGAWPSTGRPAPTTAWAWPTGSRGFRITSISTAARPNSCVPM